MRSRWVVVIALIASVAVLGACTSGPSADIPSSPDATQAPPAAGGSAAGSQLAVGLHETADGKVVAIGKLEWRDLEGGFWVVTGGTEAEGNLGETVAVIANGDSLKSQLEPLKGKQVSVVGKRLDGASIRMAGPEVEAEKVEEVVFDAAGAAAQ